MASKERWYLNQQLLLELFVLVNLAFLAPDIYLAHSTNFFRNAWEYVPLYFSVVAPIVLLIAFLGWTIKDWIGTWRILGHLVGGTSVVIGIAGLILHLDSHFFADLTLKSLVYTAPFAAPLSYTGIGLLLIMNRMVDPQSMEWPLWVLFLALGGFAGNFIFSLADHAQNGFFYATEWIPVASSAFVVGFLLVPFLVRVSRSYVYLCALVLLAQAGVGVLGFYYHNAANFEGPASNWFDNIVYGAPSLAPLLFADLALLALLGLWILWRHLPTTTRPLASAQLPHKPGYSA